jgi:hypothetical protein
VVRKEHEGETAGKTKATSKQAKDKTMVRMHRVQCFHSRHLELTALLFFRRSHEIKARCTKGPVTKFVSQCHRSSTGHDLLAHVVVETVEFLLFPGWSLFLGKDSCALQADPWNLWMTLQIGLGVPIAFVRGPVVGVVVMLVGTLARGHGPALDRAVSKIAAW